MEGGKKILNYRGHLITGFICFCTLSATIFLFFSQAFCFNDIPIWLIVCLFASLVPDLDHKASKIHEWAYLCSIFSGCTIYLVTGEVYHSVIITVSVLIIIFSLSKLKHRGVTHHAAGFVVFILLLYVAFYFIHPTQPGIITLFGAVGYMSHLVSDYISTAIKIRRTKKEKRKKV